MLHRASIDSCAVQCPCSTRTSVRTCRFVPITPARRARSWCIEDRPTEVHHAQTHGPVTTRGKRRPGPLRSRGAAASHAGDGTSPSVAGPSSTILTTALPLPEAGGASALTEEAPPSWPALQPPFTYYASAEDAQSNAAPTGLSPIWKVLLLSDGSVTRHLQLISGSPVAVECLSMRHVGWSLAGLPPGTELIPGPRVQRQVVLRCQPGLAAAATAAATAAAAGAGAVSDPRAVTRNDAGSSCAGAGVGEVESDTCKSTSSETGGPSNSGSSSSSSSSTSSGSCSGGLPEPGGSAGLLPLVYASSWWNADTIDEYLRDKSQPIWVSLSQGHVELYREVHALFRGHSPPLQQLLGCEGPFWGRQYIFWSGGRPLTLIYEVFSPRLQDYLGPQDAGEPLGSRPRG